MHFSLRQTYINFRHLSLLICFKLLILTVPSRHACCVVLIHAVKKILEVDSPASRTKISRCISRTAGLFVSSFLFCDVEFIDIGLLKSLYISD